MSSCKPVLCAFIFTLLLAACGDVGQAPQAETGDVAAVTTAQGVPLPIDTSRSSIKWRAAKVTRAHDGGFRTFSGTVTVDSSQVTGVSVQIDTRSIWTDPDRLVQHLQSPDFFDVETYPTAAFESTRIVPMDSAGATHLVTGNLTMHGQTNGVTFPAKITVENGAVHTSADFIIDRTHWGINYKGKADDLIEDKVRLILDITASGAPAADSTAVTASR